MDEPPGPLFKEFPELLANEIAGMSSKPLCKIESNNYNVKCLLSNMNMFPPDRAGRERGSPIVPHHAVFDASVTESGVQAR